MTRHGPPLTRRRLLTAGLAVGAAGLSMRRPGRAESTLRLLCWPGYDDGDATEGFRKATGFDVEADTIGANDEIFTFLRAGGVGTYDVVTPGNGVVQALADAKLIQPIDLARIPNAGKLFPAFAQPAWSMVGGQVFGLPLSWRTAPLVYDADRLSAPPAAWTDLVNPEYRGKVAVADDVVSNFLIWNRALGASDPARVTVFQLNQTVSMLVRIKRDRAAAFVGGQDDLAEELAHGRATVSTAAWPAVPWLSPAKGANLKLAHPQPGDFSVCDSLCLPTGAPNLDAAYRFLDHMVGVEAQVALANKLYRATVNAEAVPAIHDDARGIYDYADLDAVFAASPLVGFPPLTTESGNDANYVDWVVAWDRVRFTAMQAFATPTPTPRSATTPAAPPTRSVLSQTPAVTAEGSATP